MNLHQFAQGGAKANPSKKVIPKRVAVTEIPNKSIRLRPSEVAPCRMAHYGLHDFNGPERLCNAAATMEESAEWPRFP